MTDLSILNVLEVYYKVCSLKLKERQGCVYWNVHDIRRETVAEHIFGAQQLAWLMWSECESDIDISKVLSMLSIHETEEIDIGDITPYDNIADEEKLERGNIAVANTLKNLKRKERMLALIDEFNEGKTEEARFAYLCDKLECVLMAKKYSDEGFVSIEMATDVVKNDLDVRRVIDNGAKTTLDVFLATNNGKYAGTPFEEVAKALKEYIIKN